MAFVIVIGGGFGGIASALRLRARGHEVCIVERQKELGGRAQVFDVGGYRHDAGPTVITAPFLFDELFSLFGEKRSEFIDFVPLKPWYRFVYQDGDHFDYGGTVQETLSEIRRINPNDLRGYEALVKVSERIYDKGFVELADKPFHQISYMIKQIPSMVKLRADKSVWDLVTKFLSNPKLQQAFSIHPLLVGGNPFDTTSIYSLIHYLEIAHGIHFVMGGTGKLVSGLVNLSRKVGIKIETSSTVDQLILDGRKVTGIRVNNSKIMEADYVVFNGDPLHLYKNLLPSELQLRSTKMKIKHSKLSPGMFVLYFGTTIRYESVAHHTIWLGKRYKELLKDIFDKQILAEDFSLYIHRPTATDPSFAPKGHDSFYVLAPVPNTNANLDWRRIEPLFRRQIINALDASILPELTKVIRAPFSITPDDASFRYLAHAGTYASIAPVFTQSAWFRFHNKAEGFENLFLAGLGVHPGAGLPGVLSSAKIIEKLIQDG